MQQFKTTDVVKFVPYYTPGGMQGGSLKKAAPMYDCYAMVISSTLKTVRVMLASGQMVTISHACVDLV